MEPNVSALNAGKGPLPWWRAWWAKLAALEAAAEYSQTDYLMDRVRFLEARFREMRAELDALKAPDAGP